MLTISDALTVYGEWWKPGAEGNKAAGTLTWNNQRGRLNLQSALTPLRGNVFAGESTEYAALHGITTVGQLATVLKAYTYGTPIHFTEGHVRETENVFSSWLVFGAHVTDSTEFSRIEARIPGVALWLGNQGATQSVQRATTESPGSIDYQFKVLPAERYAVTALPGTISFHVRRQHAGELDSTFSITASGYLTIEPTAPQSIEWLLDRLTRVTTFLAFLAGSPMSPDQLSLKTATDDRDVDLLVTLARPGSCRFTHAHEFLMLRSTLGLPLETALSRWIEVYGSVSNPSQLALSVLYSENLWLHVEFLTFMQALEGFHRAVVGGSYMTEKDYQPFRKAMAKHIPVELSDGHRAAIKSKIKYGYEYSLQKRIDQLVARLALPIRKHVLFDDGNFPRLWIDTRNYYTHWDSVGESSALDGVQMHYANVRMRHLLRVLYLDFIGVPSDAILRALSNQLCDDCAYLAQLNAALDRRNNPGSSAGLLMSVKVERKPV
jgi:hypothetical protein